MIDKEPHLRFKDAIIIYTDGGAINNPGKAAYAFIVIHKDKYVESFESFRKSTNNRMELMAAIKALTFVKDYNKTIIIFTDSEYLKNTVEKKWIYSWVKDDWKSKATNKPVLNSDLMKDLYIQLTLHKNIRFVHVPAHSGVKLNERCDELVKEAMKPHTNVEIDMPHEYPSYFK
jgi:ribonuclease HI